ncbi:MAG: hypothetical protein WDN26_01255 [Chitinophagaceae bacterium]
MKLLMLSLASLAIFSACNSGGGEKKDDAYWEKKIMESMNTEEPRDGGGAYYPDKVEIVKRVDNEDGSADITFLWWGEYRNGSIQGFEPRKVKGEKLTYGFDKYGDRITNY